ncbi:DUF1161 domain-containing protein [Nevskia soli]|uniref:DUF1161 domain-containing protein n=1 Tax=Nevskia soli TaxID=418856 RepID=UPI0004A73DC3|nr:DUF1161 domain-containing protein [Nevskia soli]
MKHKQLAIAALLFLTTSAAWATPCDSVKEQIDAKIKAKGVKTYTLDVVPAAEVKEQKVVGSCEGGAKKIVYKRS